MCALIDPNHRLIIAGIIGVALFFAVMALSSILFRQYYLTVNVFNFDPNNEWNSLQWYDDNANISNGEWKTESIAKFVPASMSASSLDRFSRSISYRFRYHTARLQPCPDLGERSDLPFGCI